LNWNFTTKLDMSVVIRFARHGRRNSPVHRIVAIDRKKARNGMPIEYLGTLDPRMAEKIVSLHPERIEYWKSQGAQMSLAVHKALARKGLMEAPVYPEQTKKCLPKKRAQARLAAAAR